MSNITNTFHWIKGGTNTKFKSIICSEVRHSNYLYMNSYEYITYDIKDGYDDDIFNVAELDTVYPIKYMITNFGGSDIAPTPEYPNSSKFLELLSKYNNYEFKNVNQLAKKIISDLYSFRLNIDTTNLPIMQKDKEKIKKFLDELNNNEIFSDDNFIDFGFYMSNSIQIRLFYKSVYINLRFMSITPKYDDGDSDAIVHSFMEIFEKTNLIYVVTTSARNKFYAYDISHLKYRYFYGSFIKDAIEKIPKMCNITIVDDTENGKDSELVRTFLMYPSEDYYLLDQGKQLIYDDEFSSDGFKKTIIKIAFQNGFIDQSDIDCFSLQFGMNE